MLAARLVDGRVAEAGGRNNTTTPSMKAPTWTQTASTSKAIAKPHRGSFTDGYLADNPFQGWCVQHTTH